LVGPERQMRKTAEDHTPSSNVEEVKTEP
jgi:hypothetical protein